MEYRCEARQDKALLTSFLFLQIFNDISEDMDI